MFNLETQLTTLLSITGASINHLFLTILVMMVIKIWDKETSLLMELTDMISFN